MPSKSFNSNKVYHNVTNVLRLQCLFANAKTVKHTILQMQSDFEQLKRVVLERESNKAFSGEALPEGVLEEILGYSLVNHAF